MGPALRQSAIEIAERHQTCRASAPIDHPQIGDRWTSILASASATVCSGAAGNRDRRHGPADPRAVRVQSLGHATHHDIAIGDDAAQPLAVEHRQATDVVVAHLTGGHSQRSVRTDAPGLDIAYKLCVYGGRGRLKLSAGKPVLPGREQVFRFEENGRAVRDVIARAEETLAGRALLSPVMRGGRRLPEGSVDLQAARRRAQDETARLPEPIRAIRAAQRRYPVAISAALRAYQDDVARDVAVAEGGRGGRHALTDVIASR